MYVDSGRIEEDTYLGCLTNAPEPQYPEEYEDRYLRMLHRVSPKDRVPVDQDLAVGTFLVVDTGRVNSIGRVYETFPDGSADVQWWNNKEGTGDSTGEWFPAWFDPAADGREVFHHTRPATARGMVWAHVERSDMVASFDWKPSTAGRYKVPPALKRYFAP